MEGYKLAKEAFVSDNLGQSIWSINVTSLTALSGYALYAMLSSYSRPAALSAEYASLALPLLLAVTILSSQALLVNVALLSLAAILYAFRPRQTVAHDGTQRAKPRGEWLEESDSDEEPSVPARLDRASLSSPISTLSSGSSSVTHARLPSQVLQPAPDISRTSSGLSVKDDAPSSSRKRRHSPTPSTHTHVGISILSTPEAATFGFDGDPSRLPRRQIADEASAAAGARQEARLPFLTVYRAHMMIMTVHCILAVDFPVFPRAQGKCENFGTSIMDVGVGSFVFSLGLVSPKSLAHTSGTFYADVYRAVRKSLPVLILGVVRVIMVKGAEYPEHVTEYGVHWNFFFTLGLLPVFGVILRPLRVYRMSWSLLAVVLACAHECALRFLSLQAWVLSPARVGLVGLNKEGLVSLPGYAAIYLAGLALGEQILRLTTRSATRHGEGDAGQAAEAHFEKRRTELALELFSNAVVLWLGLWGLRIAGMDASRRLANLAYVLWIAAYNTTFLFGYLAIELQLFPTPLAHRACTRLLGAINANGLAVFLVANLATGLVNVSMQTMYAGTGLSMCVLLLYSIGVCAVAWVGRGVRLRL